jgi:hypothetical protein
MMLMDDPILWRPESNDIPERAPAHPVGRTDVVTEDAAVSFLLLKSE